LTEFTRTSTYEVHMSRTEF